MPLGQKKIIGTESGPIVQRPLMLKKQNIKDLIADMIKEEVNGIKDYELIVEVAQRIYPEGIKDAAVRHAIANELKHILSEERNHVLMLRAIQNKLYEQ
jgi:hypothetical protein